jgi:Tetratricopeptide repeat
VVFIADDLAAWLVGLVADAGRKKLTTWVLGTDQERALRRAATAAIQATVVQLAPSGGQQAEQLAMVISEVFREPKPDAALAGQATLLQALQAGVTASLAVLDDSTLTGTGQSSAEMLGVPASVLAEALANHLVQEIMVRGSGGGPLAPLADQLNHDRTYLQGQRVEGRLAELGGIVTVLAETASGRVMAGKPVRLPPRPAFLAGREDLLGDVDTRLTGGDGLGPRVVVLYGLGGAGKTSVAVEYAHQHLGDVGVAWQFPAEDTTVLAAGFTDLAAQLGIGGSSRGGDPVAAVHSVLAAFPAGWLLVFDNVPGPEQVREFLPPAGSGRVLITSRNALWPSSQAVEVPVLGPDAAAAFLVDRSGDPDEQAARALTEELGGLPLALEQSAAYIQATGGTLAGYLALFQRRRGDVLGRGGSAGYPGTVATTWSLAFADLEQSAPAAAGLLRLLACCAPEPVPLRLLLQPGPALTDDLAPAVAEVLAPLLADELTAGDAVAALQQYSLARPAGDAAVSAHRLVQAVTADQMPAALAQGWRRAAASVIEAAIPSGTRQPGTWPACAALLPHARAVLDLASNGMERIATYLGSSGSHGAARDLFQLISDARKENNAHGPEHPDTLTARGRLAYWTGEAGDAAGARDQFAALLPIEQQVLGPDHPDTLSARGNLARWTGEAGDAAGAQDQFAALVPVRERICGPEHPDTLATRGHLAYWTGEAGDAARARDQFTALVPVREQVSGPEHPDTLIARANLAYWTGRAGDPTSARDQFAALVPASVLVLGAEHPSTLAARAYHARWTGETGDAAAARDQFAALVPVRERISGPDHPDTLVARANLARWTGDAGDPAAARDLFAALLLARERASGAEHPDTLTVRAYLAHWTGEAGDPAAARDLFAALLPVRERVSGPEHPNTVTVRTNLATWTRQASQLT